MAGTVAINGSGLGNALQQLLVAQDIQPGDAPSYTLCKTILAYHPLGLKLAEAPIKIAQSQKREITIPNAPEEKCRDAFEREWKKIKADRLIRNTMRLARAYGIASVAIMCEQIPPEKEIDYWKLANLDISFNVFDPLNTAGSLVLSQNPNDINFQHTLNIRVNGIVYHRSRACVMMNEDPIYIEYTSSAFGFVGRSVYQRPLFPLKSFIQTMVTDDLVTLKAGVLVAMLKPAGSIVDSIMQKLAGVKRALLKEAQTGNVLSIDKDEKIETLDLQNVDSAMTTARKNILENIAAADDMPATLLNSETFAEGFGEGTEDAKKVAQYVDLFREEMAPIYEFFDRIVQHRAWNEDFYKSIQKEFPQEYGNVEYKAAFQQWRNSFTAVWPSLLREPESERIKVDDVRLRALIALVQVLLPVVDPESKGELIGWCQDNFNELKLLFKSALNLDIDAIKAYAAEQQEKQELEEPSAPRPFSDSEVSLEALRRAVASLPDRSRRALVRRFEATKAVA